MSESVTTLGGESRWIPCPGCSGEIGVPAAYPADVVCCPKCAAVVRIDERMRVLWRPAGDAGVALSAAVPAQWIACHGCDGEIGVPLDWLGATIACPKCGSIVAMQETARVLWRPPPADAPQQYRPAAQSNPVPRVFDANAASGKQAAAAALLVPTRTEQAGHWMVLTMGKLARSRLWKLFRRLCVCVASLFLVYFVVAIIWEFRRDQHWSWEHSTAGAIERFKRLGGSVTTEGGQVIALDLRGTLADDGDLKYLAFLPWIKRLDVSETAIDNVGVSESVSSLTKLEWISFRQTRVTYNGIETILNVMPWVTIVDAQGFSGNAEARRHREQEAADALEVALEKFASSSRATGRKSLRKVIADYPNTKAAREAKVLLDGSRTPVNNR